MLAMAETSESSKQRLRLRVRGVVQGVGFRPFVFNLARACELTGLVGNDSNGVFIEVEGTPKHLQRFQQALKENPPPLSHILSIKAEAIAPRNDKDFVIVASKTEANANTLISPDICVCEDCLRELFDPTNRRYRYPFINCTNCGPRFTITKDIPYDRPQTTMAGFQMCAECLREYDDPTNRRFHAQPNACAECGPQVQFVGAEAEQKNPIAQTQASLCAGNIVAIKGIGGFHLACDAYNDSALQTLRERKGRVDKPFAVMVRDVETALRFVEIDEAEKLLLTSKERPIVLLKKKPSNLSALIAPGNEYLGVMLPYSPLHYLLLDSKLDALVMTSGNYSNEPIIKDNDEALQNLATLADAFLLHNRDIHVQCDDSVLRVFEGHELPIRRSRGYAPFPVRLPFSLPSVLAVGGELKSTFCLVKDDYAFMSQHLGDMENLETLQAFEKSLQQMQAIFRVTPEIIAADNHPRYLSSQWAHNHQGTRQLIGVQHHHAHIAAVLAENQWNGDALVIGVSFDGTGYGTDGAIWGGEVLLADYQAFQRIAHLRYAPLPGGDASIKRPYRTALAYLWQAGIPWDESLPSVAACSLSERKILRQQLEKNLNTAQTSSMGRLFDAVAALAGVRQTVTYEAQAAIEFEAMMDTRVADAYTFALCEGEPLQIDFAALLRAVVADVQAQVPVPTIAAKFHNAVANLICELALHFRAKFNLHQVALSGGVFQNVTLLQTAKAKLLAEHFTVFTHKLVPPNDGGLALGQAVIAGKLSSEN